MNDQMQNGIAEATRLTQQGRLDEATAAIQRALGGTFTPSPEGFGNSDEPIEATSRLIKRTPHEQENSRDTAGRGPGAATWTTPGPTLLTRGVQRPQGKTAGRTASVPEGGRFL